MKKMNINRVKRILRDIHSTEFTEEEKMDAMKFICKSPKYSDYRRISKNDLYVALSYVLYCLGK